MKKNLFILVLFLGFISLSCSSSSDGDVVIKFWAMGSEAEYVGQLIPEFEKLNPHIKIKVQAIPWTAAQEKLITAYASDNTPDICQLGNTWIPQFAALNAIVSLNEYISKSKSISEKNYFTGIWDTNVIDSHVYGIPWYIDTRVLFYRKDILQVAGYSSPPRSWKELYDVSKKIKLLFPTEKKYAIFLPTNEWTPFIIFGLQNGAPLLKNNNAEGDFSEPKFRESIEFLDKFYKEKLSPIGISQVTNVYQALRDTFFSMYISGPWNIPEFKKWMINDLADDWMTAPLPAPDGNYPGLSLAGGSSLVIFKGSKYKKEVWKFIEYLSLPGTQLALYNYTSDLPAVKEAWEDSTLKTDKYMRAFYKQFHNVIATPKIPEWEHIAASKVQLYAEIISRNVVSPDSALILLDRDVNKILEKRRWMLNK